ncbi:salicylate hydroxylase [Rathayibacter sp. AY1A2]|uniref:FAD-dependent oxidoreductase n=1 Tax=Rathayibacter sp. AY1A2 TaxID=2080520 RepID=UPI000CE88491|nr:NAD(P)/FAD-dependent oxidoreductase [Rathayibacter sp. AY1A2]PPF35094.1 salicylate hydroxylase [Rathayibacter sp. AY1A2]
MTSSTSTNPIAVLGAGPAGMAAALGLRKAGHEVVVYERYRRARPAGNILNLWPPPIKALQDMGVDTVDLGAPCHTTFRNAKGRVRADVDLPAHVVDQYGGGFIGMLRPDLYERMLAAMPADTIEFDRQADRIDDHGDGVTITFSDGVRVETPLLIGADGIDSMVRRGLWGATPKRPHDLHIIGGFTFADSVEAEPNEVVLSHNRTVQGTYTSIRSRGRSGYQWWVLEAWGDDQAAPADLRAHAAALAAGFSGPLAQLVAATPGENLQRWPIRDIEPPAQWSKGRITLAGDAAHATSPYAAYGAGMSICDGYFLGQLLAGVDLSDSAAVGGALSEYDRKRIPHTREQVQSAYMLGRLFHHAPAPLRPIRDFLLDHTPFLQKQVGERNPREIMAQLEEMGGGILSRA